MQTLNLKAYLANIGMTSADFSVIIDCDPKYLSRLISGKLRPGRRLAKDIYQATGGVIQLPTKTTKRQVKIKEQQQSE